MDYIRQTLLPFCIACLLPLSAVAGDISVIDPYVRLTPPGAPHTAAFMTLKNNGNQDRKLVNAESNAARKVELHTHKDDNGIMKMRAVTDILIKAKNETTLAPGGYHIMLLDLQQALKEGDTIPLTLHFDDGSQEKIEAAVKKPVASASGKHHPHPHHPAR